MRSWSRGGATVLVSRSGAHAGELDPVPRRRGGGGTWCLLTQAVRRDTGLRANERESGVLRPLVVFEHGIEVAVIDTGDRSPFFSGQLTRFPARADRHLAERISAPRREVCPIA